MNDRKSDDILNVSEKLHKDAEYLREQIKKMDDFIEKHHGDKNFMDSINRVEFIRNDARFLLGLVEHHPEFNKKDEHE